MSLVAAGRDDPDLRKSRAASQVSQFACRPAASADGESRCETLAFVAAHSLMGRGLGRIDMHLLASARLAKLPFWTMDKRLAAVASDLQLQN